MTGLLVGLLLGAGLFCIWWSCWTRPPARERAHARRRARLADELVQAGLDGVRPAALVLGSIVAGAVVLAGFWATTRVLPVAGCFAAMTAWAPVGLVRARARSRRAVLRELWPDAVDNLASGVRAGLALPEALGQLQARGPEELRPAFAAFAEDYRATGHFQSCLDRLKERLSDPVADRLVESLRIARDVGGSDLGRLLRTLSTFLRDDARTRAELETRQGWTVNAARLAVAAPWLVLAMMSTRTGALAAYGRPAGVAVLVGGGVVCLVAYRVMLRIGRLPEDPRVLR